MDENANNENENVNGVSSLNKKTLQYFVLEETTNTGKKKYRCLVCRKQKIGTKIPNLTTHLKLMHSEVHAKIAPKGVDFKSKMALKRLELVQHCVEIVTINKKPFTTLLSSGFQKVIKKKLMKLKNAGYQVDFNNNLRAIKRHLHETAVKIKEKLKIEISKRFFSLSCDIVKKNNRSVLGIYLQYIIDGVLKVRCVGMKEIKVRHTGANLSLMIRETIKDFGSNISWMAAATTDNGSNMKTLKEKLNELLEVDENDIVGGEDGNIEMEGEVTPNEQADEQIEIQGRNDYDQGMYDIQISNIINNTSDQENEEEIEELFDCDSWNLTNDSRNVDLASSLNEEGFPALVFVDGINCAAHTLQLAVKDALKVLNVSHTNVISLCRSVSIFIRHTNTLLEIGQLGLKRKLPALDTSTRWSSTYLMASIYHRN